MKYKTLLPYKNYDAIIAAVAGFLIIHAFSRQGGIGVSPDSVVYMSTAANIHDRGVIYDFTNTPVMDFPFFYPIFLSGVMFLTGLSCMQFGPALNGILFGLLIYLCGWMMERFAYRSKIYKWTILSVIVLSPCLLEIYSMIWSETLYLLLLLGFFIAAERYFRSYSIKALFMMALLAGLTCITRYAGITLIATGGLLILFSQDGPRMRKWRHILFFGLLAIIPPAINLIRNKLLTTTLTGFREKGVTSFSKNLDYLGNVFSDWMPFITTPFRWAVLIGFFWVVLFLLMLGFRIFNRNRKEHLFTFEGIAIAYFVVYSLFMLIIATVSRFQPLDGRLLSPLFIPWVWGTTSWLPGKVAQLRGPARAGIIALGLLAVCWFQAGQLVDDYETWDGVKEAGIPGYTEADWRNSQTMNFVRDNKKILQRPGATLYSNAFEGVWFLTGIKADLIPHKDFTRDIKEFLGEDHFYLVWFNDGLNPDLLSVDDISKQKTLAAQKVFNDGAIYYFVTDSTAWKHPAFQ